MADLRGKAEQMAAILTALANPTRLRVIIHLIDKEVSVNELANQLAISTSALSQHLAKLRAHNLVETRREAQTIFYSCKSENVHQFLDGLRRCLDDRR